VINRQYPYRFLIFGKKEKEKEYISQHLVIKIYP
jgi:hypothetical protein